MDFFAGGTPTRQTLDAVLPDRPAILSNCDGHGTWDNIAPLRLAGVVGFRRTAIKIMQDRVAENVTAAMTSPYLGGCGCPTVNAGLSFVDPRPCSQVRRTARRRGLLGALPRARVTAADRDDVTGHLCRGFHADLVVLAGTPSSRPPRISEARVVCTYVGGEQGFRG